MQTKVTRRSFLKGASATGIISALGLFGCSPKELLESKNQAQNTNLESWANKLNTNISDKMPGNTSEKVSVEENESCDLLVIGGGCSGINTAVRAAEQGLATMLLEKSSSLGGASLKSWAPCAYNSRYALEAGDITDTEPLIEQWVADSHWRVDAAAIRQLVNNSGEAIDWMAEKGWNFSYLGMGSAITPMPDYDKREPLYKAMLDATVNKNGKVLTGVIAKKLLVDVSGAVTGALAVDENGKGIRIDAKKVVIATGGYAGNAEMVKEAFGFDGAFAGLPQNIGEGLEMAWQAGAQKPVNFGGQMLHQTLARTTNNLNSLFNQFAAKYPMILCYVANLMNVSATGSRFRNESLVLDAVPAANSSAYQGSFHYVVISQQLMEILEEKGLAGIGVDYSPGLPPEYKPQYNLNTPWENITEVLDAMVEAQQGYKANSPEELAKAAGMDEEIFANQFSRYESYCSTGADDQFGKTAKYLKALGTGPYYLIIAEENNLCSWGGLLVNSDYEVLNDSRIPIKGLYAVGNEAGGNLYNDTYVGFGYGMANAITSGYLCGTRLGTTS